MNGVIEKGAVNVSTFFNLGVTGITITTLTATYERPGSAISSTALTALAAITTAHTDNYGIEISSTYAPGVYRVDWPDAAFATGVDRVLLSVISSGGAHASEVVPLVEPLRRKGAISSATGITSTAFRDTTTSNKNVTDYYKDMVVCFTSGALKGLGFRCSAYANDAGNNTFTVSTMPENPSNGDEFVIIGRTTA